MEFSNLGDLQHYLMSGIQDALKNYIEPTIKEIEATNAAEMVYKAYSPSMYNRRYDLTNDENLVTTYSMSGNYASVSVDNKTEFYPSVYKYGAMVPSQNQGDGLAVLINGGDGAGGYYYDIRRSYGTDEFETDLPAPYMQPRPFIDRTMEEIEEVAAGYIAMGLAGYLM